MPFTRRPGRGHAGSSWSVWVSGFVTGRRVGPDRPTDRRHRPGLGGLLVAVAVAMGFRAGGRGGPLALEDAEVTHVLLSPVDRGAALVGPALRQIRTSAFIGRSPASSSGSWLFAGYPGTRPRGWRVSACSASSSRSAGVGRPR